MESLVEQVYNEEPPPHDLLPAIKSMWRDTADDWNKAVTEDANQAAQRLIKVPSYDGQLADFTRANLEEDSPDLHKAFQALTRLTEPNVSVICLESTDALNSPALRVRDEAAVAPGTSYN